jgi:predicted nucleic acid-binding protein
MPIRYLPHGPIIPTAFDLERENDLTLYEAVYIALALEHGAVLFSADSSMRKIADKLSINR